jgi:nitrogen fixation-related uncharacterized protein
MIEWTNGKIAELISLARGAAVLLAIVMVGYAYLKTRSLVTLLLAALTAGFFLWTINNTDWWQQKVEEESSLLSVVELVATETAHDAAGAPAGGDTGLGWV